MSLHLIQHTARWMFLSFESLHRGTVDLEQPISELKRNILTMGSITYVTLVTVSDHSETTLLEEKKKRKSVQESRSGCIICRSIGTHQLLPQPSSWPNTHHMIRHIKCDEQKPECSRCRECHRRCGGYSVGGSRPRDDMLQVIHWRPNTLAFYKISGDFVWNKEERRAFRFFGEQPAADLPGFFGSSFWSQSILQAGHVEPSIKHAVLALGSLHEIIHLVPPLYVTATRCRDPWVRREALSLLASTYQQKGIQNSVMSAKLAERLVCIQEGGGPAGRLQRSEVDLLRNRLSLLDAAIASV